MYKIDNSISHKMLTSLNKSRQVSLLLNVELLTKLNIIIVAQSTLDGKHMAKVYITHYGSLIHISRDDDVKRYLDDHARTHPECPAENISNGVCYTCVKQKESNIPISAFVTNVINNSRVIPLYVVVQLVNEYYKKGYDVPGYGYFDDVIMSQTPPNVTTATKIRKCCVCTQKRERILGERESNLEKKKTHLDKVRNKLKEEDVRLRTFEKHVSTELKKLNNAARSRRAHMEEWNDDINTRQLLFEIPKVVKVARVVCDNVRGDSASSRYGDLCGIHSEK